VIAGDFLVQNLETRIHKSLGKICRWRTPEPELTVCGEDYVDDDSVAAVIGDFSSPILIAVGLVCTLEHLDKAHWRKSRRFVSREDQESRVRDVYVSAAARR
jgi:hypothetical protein